MAFLSLEQVVRRTVPFIAAIGIALPMQARAQEGLPEVVAPETGAGNGTSGDAPAPDPVEALGDIPPLIPLVEPDIEAVQPPTTKPISKNICPSAGECSRQGSTALAEGDYHRAIELFEEGLRHKVSPTARATLYFNLATANEHAGKPEDALTFYRLYLKGGKELDQERAQFVRQRLPALELYATGKRSFRDNNLADALASYQNAMTAYPSGTAPTTLCVEIVRTYSASENLDAAIEYVDQCVEMESISDRKDQVASYKTRLIEKKGAAEAPPAPAGFDAPELKLADDELTPTETSSSPLTTFLHNHWPSITAGAVAAGATGAAIYFHGDMNDQIATARQTCAPNCSKADLEGITSAYTTRNIAITIGAVAAGAGIAWEILNKPVSPPVESPTASDRRNTSVSLLPSLGSVALRIQY